jgi:hypothetical protein
MKMIKLASAAIVAMFALWAANAKALPATYQFERLNFILVAEQQGLVNVQTSPGVYVSTLKPLKVTTKDLLKFLATACNTNWPAGSQLAVDNLSQDIFIVDKNGKNPVFNVSAGINVGGTNVAYLSFGANPTVFTGRTASNKTDTYRRQTHYGKVFLHLFSEQNGITNTDLYLDGLDAADTNEHTVNATITVTGSESAWVTGDGTFNNTWVVIKGRVTGFGKWSGLPAG